jgi:glycosyltransferase involved in cell wall biosynthesis
MTLATRPGSQLDPVSSAHPRRVLTWHVHGSYLAYLAHTPVRFLLPVKPGRPEGYGGRAPGRHWPGNVEEVPAEAVREQEIDVILYQSRRNYEHDGRELLGPREREIPRIHLEHDPPRESPTDTPHLVSDPDVLVVHVTPFNQLMWDNGTRPTRVIEHGVVVPERRPATHELARGIVVINDLASRGRRLGLDVFERLRRDVALDLVGMASERLGGLGALTHEALFELVSRYRYYASPIRYTSLGLATLEAMALGVPVVGLATAELATVVENGRSGFVDTDVDRLVGHMRRLQADPDEARQLGEGARARVRERFGIERFASDWLRTIEEVAAGATATRPPAGAAA